MTTGIENTEIHKYVSRKWKTLSPDGKDLNYGIKHKKDTDIGNLKEKTLPELEDLLMRQEKILNNKKFITSLPDKGKKLQTRYAEIHSALEELKFSKSLSFQMKSNTHLKDVQVLEWPNADQSEIKEKSIQSHNDEAADDDSDSEDLNPLKLMANHSSDTPAANLISNVVDDSDPIASIKEELDKLIIEDSKEKVTNDLASSRIPPLLGSYKDYEEKLVRSVKKIEEVNKTKRNPFKPFQTLRSTALPCQVKEHTSPIWVESAATGPLRQLTLKPAQAISLDDSIKILNENKNLQKEKEYWKTIEGLHKTSKEFNIGLPEGPQMNYRDANSTIHLLDDNFDSEPEDFDY